MCIDNNELKLFDQRRFSNNFIIFLSDNIVTNQKSKTYVILCTIWYHFYNFKNVKNTHGGVLLLVKLHTEFWNFNKTTIFTRMFFIF